MDVESILKLIQAVSDSELTDFSYEADGVKLDLCKKKKKIVVEKAPEAVMQTVEQVMPQVVAQPMIESLPAAGVAASAIPAGDAVKEEKVEGNEVKSPLVGIFYSAPSPEEPAFVKVGDKVKKGQTLGIVEAMKLMNEIECEYDGEVKAILVENEEVVEYGQPLFVIG